MALKFLNKKGWHTGSLRNVENVWKAEQKHEAEQKKLEELRKQIQEEKERNEFRLLQEKAGLVPKQERLEFLYDSGLSVGRSANNEGFRELQAFPTTDGANAPSSFASASASKQQPSVPGALFEDKPQSSNDAWRKLHSDPLLMIRQREQEALARIKNNPVKMAMIRKTVQATEPKKGVDKKKSRKKHKHDKLPRRQYKSEDDAAEGRKGKSGDRNSPDYHKRHSEAHSGSENESSKRDRQRKRDRRKDRECRGWSLSHRDERYRGQSPSDRNERYRGFSPSDRDKRYRELSPSHTEKEYRERSPSDHSRRRNMKEYSQDDKDGIYDKSRLQSSDAKRENGSFPESSSTRSFVTEVRHESHNRRRNVASKLSEEERAAKLRQMQLAAELHEDQRWKRLKNAEENDAKEAIRSSVSGGKNFLDAAQKSVYGAGEGGSSSIAESVRRRTHYSQGKTAAGEGNAFRR